MFLFVPYLSGQVLSTRQETHECTKMFTLDDLEKCGLQNRHTVAFHMIGNWSLGDYFKDEQLVWVYELFIEKLGLDINRVYTQQFCRRQ